MLRTPRVAPRFAPVLRWAIACLAVGVACGAHAATDSLLTTTPRTPPRVVGALTLDDALQLAARFHPGLAESAWRVEAATQRVRDANRHLNPTIEATFENFGGSLPGNPLESTISATQTFEIGGTRGARVRVAEGERTIARMELDSRQRAVVAETGEAFVAAWWLAERVRHLLYFEQIAARTVLAARERTRIGAAPPVDGLRAQALEAQRAIERRAAEAELREARRQLALQWGASVAEFDSLVLPAATVPDLPSADSLLAGLERNPERMRAAAETAVEAARIREARALRFPGLAVHGGVRQFRELSAIGFVAGLSLELPLWDRGAARIQAAEADHRAAVMREHAERLRLEQELRADWDRLIAARDQSELARTRALPAARQALIDLERGFRAGRFTYLDQLEGQRAGVEAELLAIDAERDLWVARFELERLLGTSLEQAAGGSR